jgi:hypothetical protein
MTIRDRVIQELVTFFKPRCAIPSLIKDENTNAKHLCGFDGDTAGWRLLDVPISDIPFIQSRGFFMSATSMDRVATIGQIADALIKSVAKAEVSALSGVERQGKARFLLPRSVLKRKATRDKRKKPSRNT